MELGDIYCITSPSGKKYIGQAVKKLKNEKPWGYMNRWKDHIRDSYNKNCCRLLNNSIRKYGHENFQIELIKEQLHTDIPEFNQANLEAYAPYFRYIGFTYLGVRHLTPPEIRRIVMDRRDELRQMREERRQMEQHDPKTRDHDSKRRK
jgi:hypothetical protein